MGLIMNVSEQECNDGMQTDSTPKIKRLITFYPYNYTYNMMNALVAILRLRNVIDDIFAEPFRL